MTGLQSSSPQPALRRRHRDQGARQARDELELVGAVRHLQELDDDGPSRFLFGRPTHSEPEAEQTSISAGEPTVFGDIRRFAAHMTPPLFQRSDDVASAGFAVYFRGRVQIDSGCFDGATGRCLITA